MIPVLFSVLLLAADTSASSGQAEPATTEATEAPKEERKICKRDIDSASRMGSKRICLTAAEWKARDGGFSTPTYTRK